MKRLSTVICVAVCAFAQAPPSTTPAAPAAAPQLEDGLYAIFNTQMGTITAKLFEKETPITVKNFVALAIGAQDWKDPETGEMVLRPLYDGIGFHRVMMDQMIQSGSAVANGDHDCGFTIKGEIRPDLKFDRPGRLAMANTGSSDSGACQFFITQVAAPPWDGRYAIFGQVVDGQSVVREISRVQVIDRVVYQAKNPPKLIGVTIKRVGPEPAPPPAVSGEAAVPPGPPGAASAASADPVERIRSGQHSLLLTAERVGARIPGVSAGLEVVNGADSEIVVFFKGPVVRSVSLLPGRSARVDLPSGSYEVAAELPESVAIPLYGRHSQESGSSYRLSFDPASH